MFIYLLKVHLEKAADIWKSQLRVQGDKEKHSVELKSIRTTCIVQEKSS